MKLPRVTYRAIAASAVLAGVVFGTQSAQADTVTLYFQGEISSIKSNHESDYFGVISVGDVFDAAVTIDPANANAGAGPGEITFNLNGRSLSYIESDIYTLVQNDRPISGDWVSVSADANGAVAGDFSPVNFGFSASDSSGNAIDSEAFPSVDQLLAFGGAGFKVWGSDIRDPQLPRRINFNGRIDAISDSPFVDHVPNPVPTPAAAPIGLALLAALTARRRRRG